MAVNYISGLVFLALFLLGVVVSGFVALFNPVVAVLVAVGWFILSSVISSGVRLAAQWERGVVLRLGRYQSTKGPGLFLVIPMIDQVRIIDTRILAVNIPRQTAITRDNVPVTIDAALVLYAHGLATGVCPLSVTFPETVNVCTLNT